MQHCKGIKRIEEIQADFNPKGLSIEKILSSFKALKLTEMFPELSEQTSAINMFVYPKVRKGVPYED